MGARYDLYENPPQEGDEGKRKLHARIVPWGTKTSDDIIDEASSRSTFSTGDLVGALDLLTEVLANSLACGYNVELKGLGAFSLSLSCREVDKKEEIHSQSIHLKNVNFRASTELKERVGRRLTFERSDEKRPSALAPEHRLENLKRYLKTHRFITRNQYIYITGCSPAKALNDLNAYIEQGILVREGKGANTFYFLV